MAGTLSWPLALLEFFFYCLITPSMLIFLSVISGNSFSQHGRFCMSSSVKTDLNCSFNTLAFAQSDVARKPELVLRVGIPVSSLLGSYIWPKGFRTIIQACCNYFWYVWTVILANILLHLWSGISKPFSILWRLWFGH